MELLPTDVAPVPSRCVMELLHIDMATVMPSRCGVELLPTDVAPLLPSHYEVELLPTDVTFAMLLDRSPLCCARSPFVVIVRLWQCHTCPPACIRISVFECVCWSACVCMQSGVARPC